jgi:hypothetical protein
MSERAAALDLLQSSQRLCSLLNAFYYQAEELFAIEPAFIKMHIDPIIGISCWGKLDSPKTWGIYFILNFKHQIVA